ncbi:MAG: ABC transporter substrate-binding protein [Ignavibacteria bacterium]|nr:ABC transporter substrate-binding protein [Ignavibacteria bacterium]
MKKSLLLSLALLIFINFSCSTDENADNKIFNLNVNVGIETLEPVMSNSTQTIWALSLCMEGLVTFDKENKITPLLAKNWTISEDALTYTFNLKTNVKYYDDDCFTETGGKGRAVTAQDFKYCLERVNDPNTKSRGLWVFRDKIKGAPEFIKSRSDESNNKIKEITGIKVINDSTLQIELIEPFAPFLSLLTMSYGFVYPREAVEYYKDDFFKHPVGTGPFKFVKWDIDKELIFEKNKDYWDKDEEGNQLPYLDGVRFTFTKSLETEFLDFTQNKYDYHNPSSETFGQITDDEGNLLDLENKSSELIRQPWLNTVYYIMMQTTKLPGGMGSPFINNKKLRQALNYGVDRKKIVRFVLKNRGFPAENGPLPIGIPGFDENIKGYTYDKAKAKLLLVEAGYPDGNGLYLTLVIGNDEIQQAIAIAIQEQMKELGVNIKLEQLMQATVLSKQQDGEFTFSRANWGADYFDPENFMALFYSKNLVPFGPNKTGYSNPRIDELYEQANKLTDFNERKKIYDEMQQIVIDDAAWLFIYYNQQVYLLHKNIEGFYLDGLNIIKLKHTKKR